MGPSRDQSLLTCPASISVSVIKYPDKTKFDGKGFAQMSRLQVHRSREVIDSRNLKQLVTSIVKSREKIKVPLPPPVLS